MTYQEKENIVNIFSGLTISLVYSWIIYRKYTNGTLDLSDNFSNWGIIFLIFMGVSILARIVIYIIFHIINKIATDEDEIPISDERDKLIKLKSTRNSYRTFSFSFIFTFLFLALGMPVHGVFIAFAISGLLAEIADNISQIYYQRKGI